jgi:hypothetical protein
VRRILALLLCLAVSPATADPCRLALALALDVSGSVDAQEYRLQLDGLAEALSDPDVEAALLAIPGAPVGIAVYEWSSSRFQRLLQDWVLIEDRPTLKALTNRLRAVEREPAPQTTGLGAALAYGKTLIDTGPACWDGTLDVSGDGENNDWPEPRPLREEGLLGDLRVNALVIVLEAETESRNESGDLPAYFRANVIHGPDAFVEVARGFGDYARAMRRKLLKELATRPVGLLEPAPPHRY